MSFYFINALLNEEKEDANWRYYANAKNGQGATITYSFMTSIESGTRSTYGDPHTGFSKFSAADKGHLRDMLHLYERVVNVHFTETSGPGAQLNIGQFNINKYGGYAYYPMYSKTTHTLEVGPNRGDLFLDTKDGMNAATALHEIGHALGLKHSFEGSHTLSTREDTTDLTVMSYTYGKNDVYDLKLFDVIALQSIYGPAKARLGNDVYTFGQDKLIWDGGGKDTITAQTSLHAVTINLTSGSWNFEGKKAALLSAPGQVFLGHYTTIESLVGSKFGDRLTGNTAANSIKGGAGSDKIVAGSGADKIAGGLGNDTLYGNAGKDSFIFNTALNAKTNVDKIADFSVVDDTIQLSKTVFTRLGSVGAEISAGSFYASSSGHAHDKSDRINYETDTGKLFYDSDGSGTGGAVLFATLAKHLALTSHDFLVIA